tara:strand:- start:415 stop:567 length:153 start_codon:yes stop_codon:yes gene_type:complete
MSDTKVTDMSRDQAIGLLISGVPELSYCIGFGLGTEFLLSLACADIPLQA